MLASNNRHGKRTPRRRRRRRPDAHRARAPEGRPSRGDPRVGRDAVRRARLRGRHHRRPRRGSGCLGAGGLPAFPRQVGSARGDPLRCELDPAQRCRARHRTRPRCDIRPSIAHLVPRRLRPRRSRRDPRARSRARTARRRYETRRSAPAAPVRRALGRHPLATPARSGRGGAQGPGTRRLRTAELHPHSARIPGRRPADGTVRGILEEMAWASLMS